MLFKKLRTDGRAVSPGISAVIIVAVTAVLVLVSSSYAYQILERQRGISEFETVTKSILAFHDGVRDVAWDRQGFRSSRFTISYGRLELVPNAMPLMMNVTEYPQVNCSTNTAVIRYNISTNYITFGDGYESYILGSKKTVISSSTESAGQALIKQESGVNILLNYRVRAARTSVVTVDDGSGSAVLVNYVDILVIRVNTPFWSKYTGDFDLVAQNVDIATQSYGPYDVTGSNCTVSVSLDDVSSSVTIDLDPGKVLFNLIMSDVQVHI